MSTFPTWTVSGFSTFSAANQQRAVKIFWLHFWGSPMSLIHFATRKMMYSIKHSGSNRTGTEFLFWFGSHFSCGHLENDLKFSGSWCPEKNILQETETMSCFKSLLGISKTKQPCVSMLASFEHLPASPMWWLPSLPKSLKVLKTYFKDTNEFLTNETQIPWQNVLMSIFIKQPLACLVM